jgi:non-ribosomal peptide synthetase component E (peptide arylation enzyme)
MNLWDHFEAAVRRMPFAPALVDEQVRWTYEDLGREVERMARSLWASGLRRERTSSYIQLEVSTPLPTLAASRPKVLCTPGSE